MRTVVFTGLGSIAGLLFVDWKTLLVVAAMAFAMSWAASFIFLGNENA